MKIRFLVDENLSAKTVRFLRQLGHDAQRVDEVELQDAADKAIAEFAKKNTAG